MSRFPLLAIASAVTLTAAPAITQVVNAAAWLPPNLPNSGVAQGAFFTIKGSQLGPATLAEAASYPLPTTAGVGGTSVTVTVNGTVENCIMYYAESAQVAGIIPSATPLGTGTITVTSTFGSVSAPITIVERNFGAFTLNEAGSGPAVITDAVSGAVITLFNPAYPGEILTLWGTGLGPVTGDEAAAPPTPVDLNSGVQVFVENQMAHVSYGGRSAFTGEDQINFTVPAGVNGCKASLAVVVGGITGNVTTLSVAPQGQPTCADTFNLLTQSNLQQAQSDGSVTLGNVSLNRDLGFNDDVLVAGYETFTIPQLEASYGGTIGPSLGSCIAYEVTGEFLSIADPVQGTFVSGGSSLTLTGPDGTKVMPQVSTGNYSGTLATAPAQFIAPGNFTAVNGSGSSTGVGPFNWSLTVPSFVQASLPSSVSRSQNLTVNWTGGAAYPVVSVYGYSYVNISGTNNAFVDFICAVSGSTGTFTVPFYILNLLPPAGFALPGQAGLEIGVAGIAQAQFAVPGKAPMIGDFSVYVPSTQIAKIQQ